MKSRTQALILLGMSVFLLVCLAFATKVTRARSTDAPHRDVRSPSATISGVIRHNSNPVSGIMVALSWQGGGQSVTTGADGSYSVGDVPVNSWLSIYVYPPIDLRLAYRAWRTNSVTGDLAKDFDLVSGYRLQGEFHQPDGSLYDANKIQINPIGVRLPTGEFLPPPTGAGGSQIEMVLAPAFYAIYDNHPHESPYYMPPTIFDLRSADLENQVITMLDRPLPYPKTPPIASLITVSEPDIDGFATVSGAPGSVPPSVAIMVLNQSATNLAMTVSDELGAFSADLYAPEGSWLLIKYDPRGSTLINLWLERAFDYSDKLAAFAVTNSAQNLPGVTIRAGELPAGGPGWQDFAAVGHQDWWAGWAATGTLTTPLNIMPGDTLTVTAQVTAYSQDLHCTGVPTNTLFGGVSLSTLFAGNGRAEPWGTWFSSRLFTPTGLPIEHEAPTESKDLGPFVYENLTCLSEHTIGADLHISITLPADISEGIYQLSLFVLGDIPPDQDIPTLPVWFHDFETAPLPPIQVGDVAAPRIPWNLLINDPIDGNRGIPALEDADDYALPNRVRTPPTILVIPRLNERTGEPIPYRLEPGSFWISGNDRRIPNPPHLPLNPLSGELTLQIYKPDTTEETIGPANILQTDIRTPSLADGSDLDEGTGNLCDVYHLTTLQDDFAYNFDQDGLHTIVLTGQVADVYGNIYPINSTYEVLVARILDLDPAQLPGTPYQQGDAFAPGLHIFPPVPAQVEINLVHMPNSDPAQAVTHTISGRANRFGYFQPPKGTDIRFDSPGEFRVDITASYTSPEGDLWAGTVTWGSVVESSSPLIAAHGRRGMNFAGNTLDDTPTWFISAQLPTEKIGIEHWLPYFSGDIAWGAGPGAAIMDDTSLSSIITIRDLTGLSEQFYDLIRDYYARCRDPFAPPPTDSSAAGLEKRLDVGEAPLCIATSSGVDAEVEPSQVEYWGYWYTASERPDVHVREIIGEDGVATAYWRFNDTYGYQIGEPADGDQEGDIKWNFGGAVMRVISETNPINEYAIYGSFWVLLPLDDAIGPRVTPPFQDATGASVNGGPIMTLQGDEIDMLFLPKGVRPGDVLEVGDVIAFSGHVGPPMDSRVEVTITAPSGVTYTDIWYANKIGWLYDPSFDIVAEEPGRWTVDVFVEHDKPYPPTGITPDSHNIGTVLGTQGQYEFYVVEPDSPSIYFSSPSPGFISWTNYQVHPIAIQGRVSSDIAAIYYTIHDKGIVMGRGVMTPTLTGEFNMIYDAEILNQDFPMLSLTAREGRWEGLADEVTINFLAVGSNHPQAASVTFIGEEIFIQSGVEPDPVFLQLLPITQK